MAEDEILVSIVIACRNEAMHIERCLQSALAQEQLPNKSRCEVLVADGMSEDGTRDILRGMAEADGRIRLIDNHGGIVSTGLNAAIRAARGQIIVRMDAHTEYAPDYVRQCVAVLDESGADNVGGPACTRGRGYMQRAICAAYHSPFSVGGARFHDPAYEGDVDTVVYGCWRKDTLVELGLFDEELVRNQDDELNFRLVRAGGRLWQSPRIRSWYYPRASLRGLFKQYYQYGYWKARVIQKHRCPASIRHLVPVMFVAGLGLGWLPAVVDPYFAAPYVGFLVLYAALNAVFSVRAARSAGWRLLPALPLVFSTYHVSYGCGFIRGIVDFWVLRRRTSTTTTSPPPRVEPTAEETFSRKV